MQWNGMPTMFWEGENFVMSYGGPAVAHALPKNIKVLNPEYDGPAWWHELTSEQRQKISDRRWRWNSRQLSRGKQK